MVAKYFQILNKGTKELIYMDIIYLCGVLVSIMYKKLSFCLECLYLLIPNNSKSRYYAIRYLYVVLGSWYYLKSTKPIMLSCA